MPISTITHQGKEIVYVDYSPCKTEEERFDVLQQTANHLIKHPGGALVLANFTGQFGRREFMNKAKELEAKYGHNVAKRAVIGVDGLKKVLLMGFNRFSQSKKSVPFDTRAEALEYLTT